MRSVGDDNLVTLRLAMLFVIGTYHRHARKLALGARHRRQRHRRRPGADDLADPGDRLGTEAERRDPCRSVDAEHPLDPELAADDEHRRVDLARPAERVPLVTHDAENLVVGEGSAGFGALQEFLETGYLTFRRISDIDRFLELLRERMDQVFLRIYRSSDRER